MIYKFQLSTILSFCYFGVSDKYNKRLMFGYILLTAIEGYLIYKIYNEISSAVYCPVNTQRLDVDFDEAYSRNYHVLDLCYQYFNVIYYLGIISFSVGLIFSCIYYFFTSSCCQPKPKNSDIVGEQDEQIQMLPGEYQPGLDQPNQASNLTVLPEIEISGMNDVDTARRIKNWRLKNARSISAYPGKNLDDLQQFLEDQINPNDAIEVDRKLEAGLGNTINTNTHRSRMSRDFHSLSRGKRSDFEKKLRRESMRQSYRKKLEASRNFDMEQRQNSHMKMYHSKMNSQLPAESSEHTPPIPANRTSTSVNAVSTNQPKMISPIPLERITPVDNHYYGTNKYPNLLKEKCQKMLPPSGRPKIQKNYETDIKIYTNTMPGKGRKFVIGQSS